MPRKKGDLVKNPRTTSARARAWRVMRNYGQRREEFTVLALILATEKEMGVVKSEPDNLRTYVRALRRTGYLRVVSGVKSKDFVYRLARDTGPVAPMIRGNGDVFDANTGEELTPDIEADMEALA